MKKDLKDGITTVSSNVPTKMTKILLACGVIAGPVYLIVGLAQAFTRSRFDITRHDLSLLSNGDLGWIQLPTSWLVGYGLLLARLECLWHYTMDAAKPGVRCSLVSTD